ncbi:MAG: triosephosphate isomerase, triosephosphate isomerase (TIM) [Candidatus Peregrinibacteria bacterium GW2011_GWF2_38_29]|nr:MAG: triosephosphate isomerase, triosephosphate isomerase (TIM) [Candidatus Peregrinibacteria bacterium GW2011_GWF2_38_29]HBB02241.1 triose-phosphate isomerase [Candidatus Peregrinibacteria bacterium]
MNLPLLLVNFKAYEKSTGFNAVALAKIHDEVASETGLSIAIAVSAVDIKDVVAAVKIPVFAQHCDPVDFGARTGFLPPKLLKSLGVSGTLLNHSEHQISDEVLQKSIEAAKAAGLFVIVCANTPEKGADVVKFGPDLIAVEPPELIGGDISVAKAKPDIIVKSVELIGRDKVLVGAGVKNGEDTKIALELGAQGILVASGVTNSLDPKKAILDLVLPFKK